ncbi:aldehyde dehydrogenase family protein, partial [Nocardioides sp. NPDC006273]
MRTHQDWRELAAEVRLPTRPFVGGCSIDTAEGSFENRNPASGALLAEVADAGEAGVDAAVRAARAAYDDGGWSRAGVAFRRERMLRFADLLADHAAELAVLDSL